MTSSSPAPTLTRWVGAGVLLVFALTVALFTWQDGSIRLICLAAVTPAAVVTMFAARWLDRRNRPTWSSTVLAIAWGAGGAVLIATWGGSWLAQAVVYIDAQGMLQERIPSTWVLTPLVEEGAKALGVVLVMLAVGRSRFGGVFGGGFGGVLGGAMIGALVGVGFGWFEDAAAIATDITANDPGYGIGTWIVRTLTSPTHAAFTIWTGAGIGLAMSVRRLWAGPLIAIAGFAIAYIAHGAVNHANLVGDTDMVSFFTALATAAGWVLLTAVIAVVARQWLTREDRRRSLEPAPPPSQQAKL